MKLAVLYKMCRNALISCLFVYHVTNWNAYTTNQYLHSVVYP